MKNQDAKERKPRGHIIRSILSGIAFLTIGGLVGSSVALLYAPRSGRATRSMIYSQGVALKEKLAEEAQLAGIQARSQLNHVRRDTRYRTREIGARLQNSLENRQYALKEAVSTIPVPFQRNGQ
jgi:gas vesicle protein